MAHVEILLYDTPHKHEAFLRKVNDWKYEAEGGLRKGHVKPYIAEIKWYDVRIPKEHVPQFLRDINAVDFASTEAGHLNTWYLYPIRLGIRLFRKIFPFKAPPEKAEKQMYNLKNSHYPVVIGVMDDEPRKTRTGRTREVL